MPTVSPTLDPVLGLTLLEDVHGIAGGGVPDLDYHGLQPVDGSTTVLLFTPIPTFTLDPVDGVTTIVYKITPDLADGPPVSVGFYARCHALLLPPPVEA